MYVSHSNTYGDVMNPDELMQYLFEIGAVSATAQDADRGTANENPLLHEHDASLGLDATFSNRKNEKQQYWKNTVVTALFPYEFELTDTVQSIEQMFQLQSPLSYVTNDIEDRDWVTSVQESWEPIFLGKLRIRFPWHEPLDQNSKQLELVLEGGGAFGTGEHATTRMCCMWLERILEKHPNTSVLDYGSGSGLLGLASIKFGASESVGIEVDVGSILSSIYNAKINGLPMVFYHPTEIWNEDGRLCRVDLRKIESDPNSDAEYTTSEVVNGALPLYDITVANILAGCLIKTEPIIAQMTKPGGYLAMSGILTYQANEVIAAYEANWHDLKIDEVDSDWVLITGIRNNS